MTTTYSTKTARHPSLDGEKGWFLNPRLVARWEASVGMSSLQALIYWEIVGIARSCDHVFFNLHKLAVTYGVSPDALLYASKTGGRYFKRTGKAGRRGSERAWEVVMNPPTNAYLKENFGCGDTANSRSATSRNRGHEQD